MTRVLYEEKGRKEIKQAYDFSVFPPAKQMFQSYSACEIKQANEAAFAFRWPVAKQKQDDLQNADWSNSLCLLC